MSINIKLKDLEIIEYVKIIIFTSIALLLMCAFFMQYFSKDICEQVIIVANNMQKIANEKTIDYDQKMPVLSNDEVGDLVVSFNKILDLEKKYHIRKNRISKFLKDNGIKVHRGLKGYKRRI